MSPLKAGSKAPAVQLPLLGGGTFSLVEALSGGRVALAFFKVSCPVCQYSFPYFDRMANLLRSKGLRVIGVSQDSAGDTAEFVKRFGVNFPVALDDMSKYPVSNAYGLTTVPSLFVVEPDGTIERTIVSWSKGDMEELFAGYRDSQNAGRLFRDNETIADFKAG